MNRIYCMYIATTLKICQNLYNYFAKLSFVQKIKMSVYRSTTNKKMTNFIPTSILSSQTSRAVLLIGIVLSFIHVIGILISVYYLVDRLMQPGTFFYILLQLTIVQRQVFFITKLIFVI